jgi:hypothetical protein
VERTDTIENICTSVDDRDIDAWLAFQEQLENGRKEQTKVECRIFWGQSQMKIQDEVNEWLKTHPVSPESMRFQFSTVVLEDPTEWILEHTLVVFYVPMVRI